MSQSSRTFLTEMRSLFNKKVVVKTKDSHTFTGILRGINEDFSLVLNDAVNEENKKFFKIFISGDIVAFITLGEVPFDIFGLAQELSKVFRPENVKLYEDSHTIMVMDRFKVNEEGVTGEGIVADRIKAIWESFKDQQKKAAP